MRKRRKKAVIEYDYEAAYNKALEDLEEDQVQRILQGSRKATVYATKEIRAGDQLEVEIYPEFVRGQQAEIPPTAAQKEKHRKAQWNLNEKNSRKQCERVINANFGDRDIWATFTYTDADKPATMEEALKNMQNYIRRLNYQRKKRGLKNARYVYTTEGTQEGRFHHHIVMDGDIDMDTVEELWIKGRRNQVRRLDKDEDGLTGMAKYITKEKKKKSQKKWTPSKGLKKPEEKVNHYKFKAKDVREMAADNSCIRDKMTRWYGQQGYTFAKAEVRYNDVNGRFYINARLHRQPERTGKWKTGRKNRAGGRGGGSRTARQRKREEDGSAGGSSGRRSRSR